MISSDYIKAELCRLAYLDGHTEGLNGTLAVMFTFRNRVRNGWWNGDWCQVLAHAEDVSYKVEPYAHLIPDPAKDYSFFLALQLVDGIFDGTTEDNITVSRDSLPPPLSPQYVAPVALYYARLDQITNPWFLEDICRKSTLHPRIAKVGAIDFFG